jgi:hypothetical protein
VSPASWIDKVAVPVEFDEEEFAELFFTSRGFVQLHADSRWGRESRVRTVMDGVIQIGDQDAVSYPVVLSHTYRVWIDLNKVLKRGLGGPGASDHEHRELRLRIAKKIDFLATQVGVRATMRAKESNREKSAERVERLSSKEMYNYGILLSLAEEQNAAVDQFSDGRLDWWGRSRINSRSDAIVGQLLAISRLKAQHGFGSQWARAIRSDLESIAAAGLVGRHYTAGAFRVLEESLKDLEAEFPWASETSDAPRAR